MCMCKLMFECTKVCDNADAYFYVYMCVFVCVWACACLFEFATETYTLWHLAITVYFVIIFHTHRKKNHLLKSFFSGTIFHSPRIRGP